MKGSTTTSSLESSARKPLGKPLVGTATLGTFFHPSPALYSTPTGDKWATAQALGSHRNTPPQIRRLDTIEVRKTNRLSGCLQSDRREAQQHAQLTTSHTARTWELIERVQRRHAPTKSLFCCGRYAIPNQNVTITEDGAGGSTLTGVRRCGSSCCLRCSPAKALERSAQLHQAIHAAVARGYHPKLATFTVPTSKWDCSYQYYVLRTALTIFNKRLRQETRRKNKCKLQMSYSFDVTFKPELFQTHLHIHALYCEASTEDISQEWEDKMFNWWRMAVRKASSNPKLYLSRTGFYVEDVEDINKSCNYIFKSTGFEVMGSTMKKGHGGGLSFRELCERIQNNPRDDASIALYSDFVQTFSGKTFASLGRGLVQELIAEYNENNPEGNDPQDDEDSGSSEEKKGVSITPDAWVVLNDLSKVSWVIKLVEQNKIRKRSFRELELACEYFQSNEGELREFEIIQRWKDVFTSR